MLVSRYSGSCYWLEMCFVKSRVQLNPAVQGILLVYSGLILVLVNGPLVFISFFLRYPVMFVLRCFKHPSIQPSIPPSIHPFIHSFIHSFSFCCISLVVFVISATSGLHTTNALTGHGLLLSSDLHYTVWSTLFSMVTHSAFI